MALQVSKRNAGLPRMKLLDERPTPNRQAQK
jgi:hypothetical protein